MKMCVYDKLSYDKVPHPKLSFSSSLLGFDTIPRSLPIYPCFSASHLSPLGDKKALLSLVTPPQQMHNSVSLCMLALFSLKSVLWQIPHTLTQYNLAQINSSKKTTLELSLCKKMHTHHIHKGFNNIHPRCRLLLLAAGLPCFDVVWCIDRSAARSWMTSSRDQKEWAGNYSH